MRQNNSAPALESWSNVAEQRMSIDEVQNPAVELPPTLGSLTVTSVLFMPSNSQMIDRVISPGSQSLMLMAADQGPQAATWNPTRLFE